MKIKKLQITSFLFLLLIISCSEPVENFYPNGNIKSVGIMKNGKKHGVATLYYINGKVQEKGNWINDKQEGEWRFYYENSKLKTIANFKNSLQNGTSLFSQKLEY